MCRGDVSQPFKSVGPCKHQAWLLSKEATAYESRETHKKGEKLNALKEQYFPVWDNWKQSIGSHFSMDNDILADGVGYRCENTLHELFNGSWYGGLGNCLHMAWDEFHTYYGDTCAMFSTRALQNCGFKMMHGARWDIGLLHIEEDNDPSDYHSDWLLDLWVQTRRVATEDHTGWGDRLRPEDKFDDPDTATANLLNRWEKGEWQIPENGDTEWVGTWDEWWAYQTPESKREFAELSAEAVHSAPWWVLRNTPTDFEPELLEFSVSSPEEDRNKLIKLASCVLALVTHDGDGRRVIYSLPTEVKPGSEQAQTHVKYTLMRSYDLEVCR
jgi:hypothetical protein